MTFDLKSRQEGVIHVFFPIQTAKDSQEVPGVRVSKYLVMHHRPLVSFKKYMPPPSSSLLQGKHQPFSPSPLLLIIFCLFVILSLTQLYRYTPEIFLFSIATFKYTYRAPLRRIGQEYSANVALSIFQSLKRIQPLPVRSILIQKIKKKVL